MSTEIARFHATISADTSNLEKGLQNTKNHLSALQTGFGQWQSIATAALAAVGAAAVAMGTKIATTGIQFNAMKEQAQIAFTTMLGSGQAAQGMLDELQAFAAKTPFEFPDLVRATQRLMAMGIGAEELLPTLTAVGDAAAAMGGSAEMIDRVTTAIGQMHAKGKVSAEEMRQLTEAGIPAWQMLADKIGVTVPEAMDMVSGRAKKMGDDGGMAWKKLSDGTIEVLPKMRAVKDTIDDTAASGVSAATGIAALTEGIEQRFGGMMEAQSHTWNGIISNIKDGFMQLTGLVMQPFFDSAKEGLRAVANAISYATKALQNGLTFWKALDIAVANLVGNNQDLLDFWFNIRRAGEAIFALINPIIRTIAKFVEWQDVMAAVGVIIVSAIAAIASAFGSLAASFATITAVVVVVRRAWEKNFLGIRTIVENAVEKIGEWFFKGGALWKGTWRETMYGMGGIQPTISVMITITQNRIGAWIQWIKDQYEGMKNHVVNTVINWKDRMLSTYHAWADPIIRDVTHWAEGIKWKFDWMVQWIIGDFGYWTKLVNYLKEKWQAFTDWWDRNIQPWVDSGVQMVQGIWDGVRDKWGQFTDWFEGKWEDLKRNFKSFFGISSPSKLFEDFGTNISLGLAQGIESGATSVMGAMDGLQAGVTANYTGGYEYAAPTTQQPQVSTARIEQLLVMLIAELRAKNMTANVTVAGGGMGYGALVNQTAGLR